MVLKNNEIDEIAITIVNILADRKISVSLINEVLNRVEKIVMMETIVKKIDG